MEKKIEEDRVARMVFLLSRKILGNKRNFRFCATGTSMFPMIRSGDVATVTPADPEDISSGDVVLYHAGERLYIHRVISVRREGPDTWLIARGDNLKYPDPPVHMSQVLGKVISVERNGMTIDLASPARKLAGSIIACFPLCLFFRPAFLIARMTGKIELKAQPGL